MGEWNLYVWTEILCDHTCGMAACMARNKEEALATMKKWCEGGRQTAHWYEEIAEHEPKVFSGPAGWAVFGGG